MSNKYLRPFKLNAHGQGDIYTVFDAFDVTGVRANAIKKLLDAGNRGYKSEIQDLKEAIGCIQREIELKGGN
jgi:hypothetical protein